MADNVGTRRRLMMVAVAVMTIGSLVGTASPAFGGPTQAAKATTYLLKVQDQYHDAFDVYSDADAAGNHFAHRARMGQAPVMDERSATRRAGRTGIRATFDASAGPWGGWYFMNGVLNGSEIAPSPNWGDYPNAGLDLRGATQLTFWARGTTGNELVEFLTFGIGRDPVTGAANKPYPDSSAKRSTGVVRLSTSWTKYTIDLTGADLAYVLGGFGWVASASANGGKSISFYLDDIAYNLTAFNQPRFLVSYRTIPSTDTFDLVMVNRAFVYDNALALLGFLARGDARRARLIADALLYAMDHDRYYSDGRLRNVYQGGTLALPPGWAPNGRVGTVRMPGWYDPAAGKWFEDRLDVSTTTGNIAWAMLALIGAYEKTGVAAYRAAAERLGNWVETNTRDQRGAGGYTGGYEGWEPSPTKVLWKSTEHAIDLMAAFTRLKAITGNAVWADRANHARQFVLAMWDPAEQRFLTGTDNDGVTRIRTPIPVDVQAWSIMALPDYGPYLGALAFAEAHHRVPDGYDFNEDRDGIWWEGTAQMAAAYAKTGNTALRDRSLLALAGDQQPAGAIMAADRATITTGFYFPDGNPWRYFRREHVGATSWFVLAEQGKNPFAAA